MCRCSEPIIALSQPSPHLVSSRSLPMQRLSPAVHQAWPLLRIGVLCAMERIIVDLDLNIGIDSLRVRQSTRLCPYPPASGCRSSSQDETVAYLMSSSSS